MVTLPKATYCVILSGVGAVASSSRPSRGYHQGWKSLWLHIGEVVINFLFIYTHLQFKGNFFFLSLYFYTIFWVHTKQRSLKKLHSLWEIHKMQRVVGAGPTPLASGSHTFHPKPMFLIRAWQLGQCSTVSKRTGSIPPNEWNAPANLVRACGLCFIHHPDTFPLGIVTCM